MRIELNLALSNIQISVLEMNICAFLCSPKEDLFLLPDAHITLQFMKEKWKYTYKRKKN